MAFSFLYVLDGKIPVPEEDTLKWAQWFEEANRVVAQSQVGEDVIVSTIFLGLDHNYGLQGPPMLFETMVFGGELDREATRYPTWEDAKKGHRYILGLVKLAEGE